MVATGSAAVTSFFVDGGGRPGFMRQSSALTTRVGKASGVQPRSLSMRVRKDSLLHSGFHGSWRNCLARARVVLAFRFACSRSLFRYLGVVSW